MKGLSIEQKAKRYDEAFERVKELLSRCTHNRDRITMVYRVKDIESIFPELKESEEKDIRKDIIRNLERYIKCVKDGYDAPSAKDFVIKEIEKQIAWLEKQGEQKPIDKVKPKFKVGDWISNDMCDVHIASIEDGMYYFDEGDGLSIVFVDEHYHLWTIEDAMEGDVLFQDLMDGKTFIYNGVNSDKAILYSFIISNDGEEVLPYHIGKPNTGIGHIEENKDIIRPANKEQHDLLFQKMKEAGYEWDSQKKELKIIDWSKHIKYEPNSPSIIEENTTWSEEDEEHLNSLIELLPGLPFRHKWLKSLKDRIQHQLHSAQEWSENDETMFNKVIERLKKYSPGGEEYAVIFYWLKSLKERVQPQYLTITNEELVQAKKEAYNDALDKINIIVIHQHLMMVGVLQYGI